MVREAFDTSSRNLDLGVVDLYLIHWPTPARENYVAAWHGLEKVQAERPSIVIMDVVMPGQNGFQLTRAITRDPSFADVPVIICTSKNQETDRVWGLRQGAKDYVVKPVNPEELLSKIKAFG